MDNRIRMPLHDSLRLVASYSSTRLLAQLRPVLLISLYLLAFQVLALRSAVHDAAALAAGIGSVILGLSFFLEGLTLGLMPLGEAVGLGLPRKVAMPFILLFSLLLGAGATLAEPAIGILRGMGDSIMPWDAPLLFIMLNRSSGLLVWAVAVGVGCAAVLGMLRFYYGWSIKPFIVAVLLPILALSVWFALDVRLGEIAALAWDSGAVTTGPVTVPLVLALGIGVSRSAGRADSPTQGFGAVTLASLLPVASVLLLGLALDPGVPRSLGRSEFFDPANRQTATGFFRDEESYKSFVRRWARPEEAVLLLGEEDSQDETAAVRPLRRYVLPSVQAVLPLCLLLMAVLALVRERPPHLDEVVLGVLFALLGLALLNAGLETGLSRLGREVGHGLPGSFTAFEVDEYRVELRPFDVRMVQEAAIKEGGVERFFWLKKDGRYLAVPFHEERYDPSRSTYLYVPEKGPLVAGAAGRYLGLALVLLFAWLMGYAATMAEPSLAALGRAVEQVTVGTFKSHLLLRSVAVGVGLGVSAGLARLIWNLPLMWLLAPLYLLLLPLTILSDEDFVSIAWDSGGVTTGPITVPVVLAMGLGIGSRIGSADGFGILALASVFPVLSVLLTGFYLRAKRRRVYRSEE